MASSRLLHFYWVGQPGAPAHVRPQSGRCLQLGLPAFSALEMGMLEFLFYCTMPTSRREHQRLLRRNRGISRRVRTAVSVLKKKTVERELYTKPHVSYSQTICSFGCCSYDDHSFHWPAFHASTMVINRPTSDMPNARGEFFNIPTVFSHCVRDVRLFTSRGLLRVR